MNNFLKIVSSLNDDTRVKLIKFIDIHGKCCVCDLVNSFEMIQSRLSRHLKILKDAGFLSIEKKGKWSYYSISDDFDDFMLSCLDKIKKLDITLPKLKKACEIK